MYSVAGFKIQAYVVSEKPHVSGNQFKFVCFLPDISIFQLGIFLMPTGASLWAKSDTFPDELPKRPDIRAAGQAAAAPMSAKSMFGACSYCKSRTYEPGVAFCCLFDPPNAQQ